MVRLKKTRIKSKGYIQYGNCQICNEKYSQRCIEASAEDSTNNKPNSIVFIFCNDCYLAVDDICSKFVFNKKNYDYEASYNINDKPIKRPNSNINFTCNVIPFIAGNKALF